MITRVIVILFLPFILMGQNDVDSIAYDISLEDFVITAQYEPTHYKNAINNIQVIGKEVLEQRAATSLKQALELTPSIRLYEDPILGTTIKMRGISSTNVAILIDNIPVIGRLNGAIDLSQIPINNIERIEIVEGPLSTIYGSNASAGVINIITKKSQIKDLSINISNLYESTDIHNHNASLGLNTKKTYTQIGGQYYNYNQFPPDSLRINEVITQADGTTYTQSKYPFNPKTRYNYNVLFRGHISDSQSIILKHDHVNETVKDYGTIKRIQFNPYANDQTFSTKRNDFSLTYKNQWKNYHLTSIVSLNNFKRIVEDNRFYIETQQLDSLLYTEETTTFKNYFTNSHLTYTSDDEWSILLGLNANKEVGQGDKILDRSQIDSTTASFVEIAPYFDFKFNAFKDLNVSIASRYFHHSNYGNNATTAFLSKYKMNEKLSLRLSFAKGYRSPSLKELYLEFIDINHNIIGNTSLKPETSTDLQMTVNYDVNKIFSFSVNTYYTNIKNQIGLVQYESLKFKYDNIDQYKVIGIQPTISIKNSTFQYTLSSSLGYWSTSIDTKEAPKYGNVFDLTNTLRFQPIKMPYALNLNHRFIGSEPNYRLEDEVVTVSQIEAYNLIDASIEFPKLFNHLRINLGAKNLLNIKSVNISGGQAGGAHNAIGRNTINQGRSWYINSSLTF